MKKILFMLVAVLTLAATQVGAQEKAGKTKVDKSKSESKAEGGKLKKDGTPDMRYKDNKAAKEEPKPSGPLKKDGTPDKRYKANKDAAK